MVTRGWRKIVMDYDKWLDDQLAYLADHRNNDIWLEAFEDCSEKLHELMNDNKKKVH